MLDNNLLQKSNKLFKTIYIGEGQLTLFIPKGAYYSVLTINFFGCHFGSNDIRLICNYIYERLSSILYLVPF